MRNRTRRTELRLAQWPTSNQERELQCVRHHTDPVRVRRFDGEVFDFELKMNNEAVTVYVPAPVAHSVAVGVIRAAGMCVLLDDGIKIVYIG